MKSMTPVGGTLIREVKVIVPMGGNVICKMSSMGTQALLGSPC